MLRYLREPFVLQYTKVPPLRWQTFRGSVTSPMWGLSLYRVAEREWCLQLMLGRWTIGIERTREED